jgi:hypothetical protein
VNDPASNEGKDKGHDEVLRWCSARRHHLLDHLRVLRLDGGRLRRREGGRKLGIARRAFAPLPCSLLACLHRLKHPLLVPTAVRRRSPRLSGVHCRLVVAGGVVPRRAPGGASGGGFFLQPPPTQVHDAVVAAVIQLAERRGRLGADAQAACDHLMVGSGEQLTELFDLLSWAVRCPRRALERGTAHGARWCAAVGLPGRAERRHRDSANFRENRFASKQK